MNENKALLLILMGLVLGFASFQLQNISTFEIPKQTINITTIQPTIVQIETTPDYTEDKLILENKLQEIYNIAYLNAQEHEFKLHEYDCTQFSENLVKKLKKLGYKAQCTAGNNWESSYTNHTWVSFWIDDKRYEIEATNGEFIEQWVFDEGYYTKWKEDYCW